MDKPPADATVEELRDWLRPRLEQPGGTTCPVCNQHAQAYKRTVNRGMVDVLGAMFYRSLPPHSGEPDGRWLKLSDIPQHNRDAAALRYFHLIVEHTLKRGWWKITDDGVRFLRGEHTIDKYAHVYRGEVYGHSGPKVSVYDVDARFDLDALLQGGSE